MLLTFLASGCASSEPASVSQQCPPVATDSDVGVPWKSDDVVVVPIRFSTVVEKTLDSVEAISSEGALFPGRRAARSAEMNDGDRRWIYLAYEFQGVELGRVRTIVVHLADKAFARALTH